MFFSNHGSLTALPVFTTLNNKLCAINFNSNTSLGLAVNNTVTFTNLPSPSFLSSSTTYKISNNPTLSTFNITLTNGGAVALGSSNSSITPGVTKATTSTGASYVIADLISGQFSVTTTSLTADSTTFAQFLTGNVTNFRYLTGGATLFSVCQPLSAAGQEINSATYWGFGNLGTAGNGFLANKAICLGPTTGTFTNESITFFHESATATGGRLGSIAHKRYANTSEILTTTISNNGTILYQNGRIVPLHLNSGIFTTTNTSPSAAGVTGSDNISLNSYRSSSILIPGPPNYWQEFIIYNRVLSNSERIDVEDYIKTKWKLSNPVYNAYAVQSDIWSKPTTWLNNTLPTTASDVWPYGFTVEIDTNVTVQSVKNSANGGGFNVYNPVTLTLLGDGVVPGSVTAITCFTGGTDTLTVVGTVRGGTATTSYGIYNSEAGTIRCITTQGIIGNTGIGIYNSSAGSVYVIGPVYGSASAANGYGIYNAISGYINVVGNIYGGNGVSSHGVYLEPTTDITGILRVTGDISAGTQSNGVAGANTWADIQLCSKFTSNVTNGRQAINVPRFLLNPKPYASYTKFAVNATSQLLNYSAVDDYTIYLHPEATNVELGTTYGALTLSGIPIQLVGTMGVPDRTAVSYGTLVSNTVGVGIVSVTSLQSAWTAPIINMKIKDTIGKRAIAAATIPEFGDLLTKISI